ncbi:hypothetical protein M885DRAFT_518095 [Pelagophyceae sp. CCMP2097]|nr:hypothetical protein M885DRAFT_518095 [Pelagophyceae sp. CCMP2097]
MARWALWVGIALVGTSAAPPSAEAPGQRLRRLVDKWKYHGPGRGGNERIGNVATAMLSRNDASMLGRLKGYVSDQLWQPASFNSTDAYVKHWQTAASDQKEVAELMRETFHIGPKQKFNSTAVVHVRCGDVPFSQHYFYHLPQPSFWVWPEMLSALQKPEVDRVVVQAVSLAKNRDGHFVDGHAGSPAQASACNNYIDQIAKCLRAATSTQVSISRSNAPEAEADFLGAQTLVVPVPSSFSFLPGFVKGPHYFTSAFVDERKCCKDRINITELSRNVPWTMHPFEPVWHADVEDYASEMQKGRFVPSAKICAAAHDRTTRG